MADGLAMVGWAALVGLPLSFWLERRLTPRPDALQRRPGACLALHAGLWLVTFGVLGIVLGRPWFAVAATTAFELLLVVVSNAKWRSLREPFVFQDFEYFTDAIKHPRLYLPFLGWRNAITAGCGFAAAVGIGIWLEPVPVERWSLSGQTGGWLAVLLVGTFLTVIGNHALPPVSFDPVQDLRRYGQLASLWAYARAEMEMPMFVSPYANIRKPAQARDYPHLVAVQSESFFDPRQWHGGIRHDVLAEFDHLKSEAALHGKLEVPAWGANTVRSEFAFLSGIPEMQLGVHRFNPYRVAADTGMATLASYLRGLGYRTICLHPYPASFYARARVYPAMGFDEFIDIEGFRDAARAGPYVGDAAVAETIERILAAADKPVFVFAITMENHGPLHLETPYPDDWREAFDVVPPSGCDDLAVYLRHLRNADRMAGRLRTVLDGLVRPSWLCWFGDHVPIMASVYEKLGYPEAQSSYVLWSNRRKAGGREVRLLVRDLGLAWVDCMNEET